LPEIEKPECLPNKEKIGTNGNNRVKILFFSFDKRILALIFVVAFITFFLIQNCLFIEQETFFSSTDSHFIYALEYYDLIFSGIPANLINFSYPPIVYLVTAVFFKIMGTSLDSAILSQQVFSLILLLAMFGIGYELGGYLSGAAVMSLAASSPLLVYHSRTYLLDFPQAATFALTLYLLLKSRGFRDRIISILFALALSISLLTKWATAFFIILPILWFLAPNVSRSKRSIVTSIILLLFLLISGLGVISFYIRQNMEKTSADWLKYYFLFIFLPMVLLGGVAWLLEKLWKKGEDYGKSGAGEIINFSYVTSLCIILTGPWYLWTASSMKSKYVIDKFFVRNMPETFNLILKVLGSAFSFAPLLLFIGLIFIFISRKDIYRLLVIPVGIIVSSLIMMYFAIPNDRYLMSLAVLAAALGGYWAARIGKARFILTFILVVISIISISWWFLNPDPSDYPLIYENHLKWGPARFYYSRSPVRDKFNISKVIDSIFEKGGSKEIITFSFDDVALGREYILLRTAEKGKRIEILEYSQLNLGLMEQHINWICSGSPFLNANDIRSEFLMKLKETDDPVSIFIREKLSMKTLQMLEGFEGSTSPPQNLRDGIAMDVNRILRGPCIFEKKRFSNVNLSNESRELFNKKPLNDEIIILNRTLLEDAYPGAIKNITLNTEWRKVEKIDTILIIHKSQSPNIPLRMILKLFPAVPYKSKKYWAGKDIFITVVKLKRNMK